MKRDLVIDIGYNTEAGLSLLKERTSSIFYKGNNTALVLTREKFVRCVRKWCEYLGSKGIVVLMSIIDLMGKNCQDSSSAGVF